MQWETVIGLEIHAQLATRSKIFSGAATTYGAAANSQACAVDLGMPGVLPVLNEAAVRMALMFGLAVGAEIAPRSVFARKNYFYPDLPKGYQISQFELPIVGRGSLLIHLPDGEQKTIGITRAHLEEDAGKSLHGSRPGSTGIDLNRAGTPLLEIVSEPDMRSPTEAVAYMKGIHSLVRYLGICDGNMQEGSFRCDANVSVRPRGQTTLGTRTELKNLNSFRFIERAINFEVDRQIDILESGGTITQETRLYDSERHETRPMRSKEEAFDYRYFPDPDLLPVAIDERQLERLRQSLPELPQAKFERFQQQFGLGQDDARQLVSSRELADYFEAVVEATNGQARLATNWITGDLLGALNREGVELAESPISAPRLAGLIRRIADRTLSGKLAKQVFEALWQGDDDADTIIDQQGLRQITDSSAIMAHLDEIIAAHPQQWQELLAGKEKLLGFFVGQVMKVSKGKANPAQVNELFRKRIDDDQAAS